MIKTMYAVIPRGDKFGLCEEKNNEPAALFSTETMAKAYGNRMWPNCHDIRSVKIEDLIPRTKSARVFLYEDPHGVFASSQYYNRPLLGSKNVTVVEGEFEK